MHNYKNFKDKLCRYQLLLLDIRKTKATQHATKAKQNINRLISINQFFSRPTATKANKKLSAAWWIDTQDISALILRKGKILWMKNYILIAQDAKFWVFQQFKKT